MKTDAQRRAENNYRKKLKTVAVRFYPGEEDAELYEWVKSQPNATAYLKGLARDDMERRRG